MPHRAGSCVTPWHSGVAALAAALWLGGPAPAQCDLKKLLASDGEANDVFGDCVAISGDAAVIGAPNDSDDGVSSGSAYIYRFNGSAWVEEQKLTASDAAQNDFFGTAVAISGDVAVIGAVGDDDNGSSSGSAYVFRFDGSSWIEEQKLTASDGAASDGFGGSIAISGGVVVIGASGDDDNGSGSGSAYVFRVKGLSWIEEQKLTASDGGTFAGFGLSVSVCGDVTVIGAPGDDDNGPASGSAYVFRFDGSSWIEEQKLLASDGGPDNDFAVGVAVSGDAALVGAVFAEDGPSVPGAVYAYRFNGATWVEEQKLLAADSGSGDQFGHDVALSGDVAVIGAPQDDDHGNGSGSAYLFRFDPGLPGWVQEHKLVPADGQSQDLFGSNVGVSGDRAVLSARGADNGCGAGTGSAYAGDLRYLRLSADCNGNGIADFVDLLEGAAADCNDNMIPDSCDIASGYSMDVNGNGIPDECEVGLCPGDLNGDGVVDVNDLLVVLGAWGSCF